MPDDANDETCHQYARAYILQCMGGILFLDKSGNYVLLMYLSLWEDLQVARQCSWGAACLAYLYRQLCLAARTGTDEIGGALIVLQVWAWERLPHVTPIVHYHPEW